MSQLSSGQQIMLHILTVVIIIGFFWVQAFSRWVFVCQANLFDSAVSATIVGPPTDALECVSMRDNQ